MRTRVNVRTHTHQLDASVEWSELDIVSARARQFLRETRVRRDIYITLCEHICVCTQVITRICVMLDARTVPNDRDM